MQVFSLEPVVNLERGGKATQYPFADTPSDKIQTGFIIFPAGSRVPDEGFTQHQGHEFSYVVSGSLDIYTPECKRTVKPGDCSFIPARELHYSQNTTDSDCVLKYIIVETD